MPKYCSSCNYYTDDPARHDCPTCGAGMQFTLLGRRGGQPDEPVGTEKPAWAVEDPDEWIQVEQPVEWRTAQITGGIGFYFIATFIWRYVLAAFIIGMVVSGEDPVAVIRASILLTVAYCVVAAVVAGIIAGAATINWVPQGLGVAGGLLVIPLLLLLVFAPTSFPAYLITIVLTTGITMVGAYLGHRLLPPSRVQKSLDELNETRAPERLAVG